MSIAERIAALNVGHVARPPAAYPPRVTGPDVTAERIPCLEDGRGMLRPPALPVRTQSTDNHSIHLRDPSLPSHDAGAIGNEPDRRPPPTQTRTTLVKPQLQSGTRAPILPPRRPSEIKADNRYSVDSISSTSSSPSIKRVSTTSSASSAASSDFKTAPKSLPYAAESRPSIPALRLPSYDPKTLPPLPSKPAEQKRPPPALPNRLGNGSLPIVEQSEASAQHQNHLSQPAVTNGAAADDITKANARPTLPQKSALEWGLNRGPAYNKSFVQAIPPPQPANKPPAQHQRPVTQQAVTTKPTVTTQPVVTTKSIVNTQPVAASAAAVEDTIIPTPKATPSRKSALEWGMNKGPAYNKSFVSSAPPKPDNQPQANDIPPPIPLASRPNLAQLQASKPKPIPETFTPPTTFQLCLHCRDFSAPDTHASRFPRTAIPSTEISWLSHALTSPFPSATDKARSIFTWLHHNIAYDAAAFFSRNVRPSTPASTIASGLAVCEGYAGLFTALAVAAGLESIVVSGHGKGFGYAALKPNALFPPFDMNHAWSAVKLDGGAWKLIDPCWGAGVLSDAKIYVPSFNPHMFAVDNADFGRRHFPRDRAHFFLPHCVAVPTWEQYLVGPDGPGEDVQLYGIAEQEHLDSFSFLPAKKNVPLPSTAGEMVRFQFAAVCPHWYASRPSYVFALSREGGGAGQGLVPFQKTQDSIWWIDVPAAELVRGMKVSCVAVDKVEGRDARGMGVQEAVGAVGRRVMSWQGVAAWVVV